MDAIKGTRRVGLTEEGSMQLVQRSGVALVVSRGLGQDVEIVNDKFTRLFGGRHARRCALVAPRLSG